MMHGQQNVKLCYVALRY